MRCKTILSVIFILILFSEIIAQDWKIYPYKSKNSVIEFPRDEGWHRNENVEWWYTCGHFKGLKTQNNYNYILCYFYYPLLQYEGFRILKITNETTGESVESSQPCNYNLLNQKYLDIQASVTESVDEFWTTTLDSNKKIIPFNYQIEAFEGNSNINFTLNATKRPLNVGKGKIDLSDCCYTYYYSLTHLNLSGNINFKGNNESISGIAWIDKQYGDFNPTIGSDYEWFSIMMNNNVDLNVWLIYDKNNQVPNSIQYKFCSIYLNEIKDTAVSDFELIHNKFNVMSYDSTAYGCEWNFKWNNIDLLISVKNKNDLIITPFRFFEGATNVKGIINGQTVEGEGFAELVHRFEKPKIEFVLNSSNFVKNTGFSVEWKLKNSDQAIEIQYDIEISFDNKKIFQPVKQNIKENKLIIPESVLKNNTEFNLRLTAFSKDKLLKTSIVHKFEIQ